MEGKLQVKMLGGFSIEWNGKRIDDSENRSRKIWLLLAYMICFRDRRINQDELVSALWENEESSENPANAMKTMLHRLRVMLAPLGENAGHRLIIRKAGCYAWNTDIPIETDFETLEQLCKAGNSESDEAKKLDFYSRAVELYTGDFLPKFSMETWVLPLEAYYRRIYIETVIETLAILEGRRENDKIIILSRKALLTDPYNEELYRCLLRSLLDIGDKDGAASVYEEMSDKFFSNFGVMPSEDIRSMYREAMCSVNNKMLLIGELKDQLREKGGAQGALICDYDFFRVLYQAEARLIARSGDTYHIALFTVSGKEGNKLPKRSLERVMENLQKQICENLRLGDSAAKCSSCQFVLMLPMANYENSCMVCERVRRAFYRQYPHSPADIRFCVQPLEPYSFG